MEKTPKLIDIKEACEFLGIPIWTLRKLVSQRRIPHVRVDKLIMFEKLSLLVNKWRPQRDLNPRPTDSKSDALSGLSYRGASSNKLHII